MACRWCSPGTVWPFQTSATTTTRVDVNGKAVLIFSHEPQERDAEQPAQRRTSDAADHARTPRPRSRAARARARCSSCRDPIAPRRRCEVRAVRERSRRREPGHSGAAGPAQRDAAAARRVASSTPRRGRSTRDLVPRSRALTARRWTTSSTSPGTASTVRNVVGVLPGSDPARAKEAIVIGAHYDHVGLGGRLSVTPERTGEIHNGADDNASGTAAIIEMAQRPQSRSRRAFRARWSSSRSPARSAACSDRRHYASQPRIPIDSTIAMLNLDMVGRARGAVDVSGLEASPSMEADLAAAVDGQRRRRSRSGARVPAPAAATTPTSSIAASRRSTSSPASTPTITGPATTGRRSTRPARARSRRSRSSSPPRLRRTRSRSSSRQEVSVSIPVRCSRVVADRLESSSS